MLQSDIQTISDVKLVIIKSLVCSHYFAAGSRDILIFSDVILWILKSECGMETRLRPSVVV